MERLPEGVQAVLLPPPEGACHVCAEEEEADDNLLLQVTRPDCVTSYLYVIRLRHLTSCPGTRRDRRQLWARALLCEVPVYLSI